MATILLGQKHFAILYLANIQSRNRTVIKIATIGLLTASLAGCMNPVMTNASLEWERYSDALNADLAAYKACAAETKALNDLQHAKMNNVLIKKEDPPSETITKRANPNKFTEQQKHDLLHFANLPCTDESTERKASFDPTLGNHSFQVLIDLRDLIAEVLTDDITIGEYNTRRQRIRQSANSFVRTHIESVHRQLNSQHFAEIETQQQRARETAERIRKANAESDKMIMDMMTEQRRQMMLQQGVVTECKDTTFGGSQASVTCTSKPGF